MRAWPALATVAVVAAGLAGCLDGDGEGRDADVTAGCRPFPHPCGEVWPSGLEGPFELQAGMPQRLTVASHDGTGLGGWLYLPDLPEGVLAPTLLVSSPYYGLDAEAPAADLGGIGLTARYVEAGYAVAGFSVRGTGVSGGCFENKGLAEQLDQVALVEWLAAQPWSNGRVAMGGTSYPGTTPFMAALHGAPHLVTILPNGPVTDPYTELHTPQGALYTMGGPYEAGRRGLVTAAQLSNLQPSDGLLPAAAQVAPERLCADLAQVLLGAELGHVRDDRDAAFWQERQLVLRFSEVRAAVFLSHGLQETAHPYQEEIVWDALRSVPKRMLLGQWDHEQPRVDDWQGMLLQWLDYWLKGIGTPDSVGVGTVSYQDDAGTWHEATSWPPMETPLQAWSLQSSRLLPGHPDSDGPQSFRSVPPPPRQHTGAPRDHLCGTGAPGAGLVYTASEAATSDGLLAGNPFLRLVLSSSQPGGIVSAHLFRLRDGEPCGAATLLTTGAADLRYHDGAFVGEDFPVDTPLAVRIDLNNVAAPLKAGDRVALVLSYGDSVGLDEVADPITDARVSRSGQPYFPVVTVHPFLREDPGLVSVLALPVAGGLVAPAADASAFPPRPFTPG